MEFPHEYYIFFINVYATPKVTAGDTEIPADRGHIVGRGYCQVYIFSIFNQLYII
jgi:hypothetical protein